MFSGAAHNSQFRRKVAERSLEYPIKKECISRTSQNSRPYMESPTTYSAAMFLGFCLSRVFLKFDAMKNVHYQSAHKCIRRMLTLLSVKVQNQGCDRIPFALAEILPLHFQIYSWIFPQSNSTVIFYCLAKFSPSAAAYVWVPYLCIVSKALDCRLQHTHRFSCSSSEVLNFAPITIQYFYLHCTLITAG